MISIFKKYKKLLLISTMFFIHSFLIKSTETIENENPATESASIDGKKINKIIIKGNKHIPEEAIRYKIPYQAGEFFKPEKTGTLIRNLHSLGYFTQIQVKGENIDKDKLNLHIILDEKKRLDDVIFEGLTQVKVKEIKKKIDFSSIQTIDEEELNKYAQIIKKIYTDKDYHLTEIAPRLDVKGDKATAIFKITEHKKNLVKRVFFKGNKNISSTLLRNRIFTREDWPGSFIDKSGSYQEDAITMDRFNIESFYQSNGYLTAKVSDVDVYMDPITKQYNITFHIEEGDLYTIKTINAKGNELISEENILARLPIKAGDLYSKEKIKKSIEILRLLWGEFGYIYADIDPILDIDEQNKTVSLNLVSELGDKVFLNKINIIGNKKTRDKVIRRQLLLEEGDLITTRLMDDSEDRVGLLGYFDQQNGVNWKINRIDQNLADLDLIVNEINSGRFNFNIGYGGSPRDTTDPSASIQAGLSIAETNLFGKGLKLNFDGQWSKESKKVEFNITEPWLLNKPIRTSIDIFLRKTDYEEFKVKNKNITEQLVGGGLSLGALLPAKGIITPLLGDAYLLFNATFENLKYSNVKQKNTFLETQFQKMLNRRFQDGYFFGLGAILMQDRRNHSPNPTKGYYWTLSSKFGLPMRSNFEFFKIEGDISWYTPLIGERSLILCLHGHGGYATPINNKNIPYRELFHIGGPATVLGFKFGEIGPQWNGDSLGAKKAFYWNAELILPVTKDFSTKLALFYNGGAGWDTPYSKEIPNKELKNNTFNYRHAIGFGIRLLRPTPVKIDVGFKLDRNKKLKESIKEVHFSAYRDF